MSASLCCGLSVRPWHVFGAGGHVSIRRNHHAPYDYSRALPDTPGTTVPEGSQPVGSLGPLLVPVASCSEGLDAGCDTCRLHSSGAGSYVHNSCPCECEQTLPAETLPHGRHRWRGIGDLLRSSRERPLSRRVRGESTVDVHAWSVLREGEQGVVSEYCTSMCTLEISEIVKCAVVPF